MTITASEWNSSLARNRMMEVALEKDELICTEQGQIVEVRLKNSFSGHVWRIAIPVGVDYLQEGSQYLPSGRTEAWFRIRMAELGCFQINFEFKRVFDKKPDSVVRLAVYVRNTKDKA